MGKYFVRDTPLTGLKQEMMLPPNRGYMVSVHTTEWIVYADAVIMNYYSGCKSETALANLLFTCGKD